MITSNALTLARDLITQWEGLELEAYQCSAGVWTIGYGSTSDVEPGDEITKEEALLRLEADMIDAIECVDQHVDVDLSDEMQAALISFVFNVGRGAFKGSTLLKLLNNGHYQPAMLQFQRWNRAGGKVVDGLTARRRAEAELFRSGM